MRTIELGLTAAVIFGCIFKTMHWAGAYVLIVSGGGLLALFYLPFGFRSLAAPKPTDQILWMTLLGGASLYAALCGEVAFLLRWPHSAKLMLMGALACAVSLLVGWCSDTGIRARTSTSRACSSAASCWAG